MTDLAALYRDDFHGWAMDQSWKLRDLAGSPALAGIDVEYVAAEIEDLGVALRNLVETTIKYAVEALIAIVTDGKGPRDAVDMIGYARDDYGPSMSAYIDMDEIWKTARQKALNRIAEEGGETPDIPESTPFRLDELLAGDVDLLVYMIDQSRER